jgi:ubiquinone/menaquinone biosynthesis C-methylase UbiE
MLDGRQEAKAMSEIPEKIGLRNAWGRVATAYEEMWARRTAEFTAQGLDLIDPPEDGLGLDVACGPGVTSAALAERIPAGRTLGVDFAPAMVERATERHAAPPGLEFALDDAERLSFEDGRFDVVTCTFGLMYCYDARAAMAHMARVLRPGGTLLNVVWGRAPRVWFVPVIELIESRAEYYSAICPLMFFYGLPGVLARMLEEAGLEPGQTVTVDGRMRFASPAEAVEAAIQGGPLAGLFNNRLGPEAQQEVREGMTAHVESVAEPDPEGIALPAEVMLSVGVRPS